MFCSRLFIVIHLYIKDSNEYGTFKSNTYTFQPIKKPLNVFQLLFFSFLRFFIIIIFEY